MDRNQLVMSKYGADIYTVHVWLDGLIGKKVKGKTIVKIDCFQIVPRQVGVRQKVSVERYNCVAVVSTTPSANNAP